VKTILILEDEPPVMDVLRQVLKGYAILEATTAEEALARFLDNRRRIDLLFSELALRVSSGIYVALLLRSEVPNLNVILASRYPPWVWTSDFGDVARLGNEAVAILPKPLVPEKVLETVQGFIGLPEEAVAHSGCRELSAGSSATKLPIGSAPDLFYTVRPLDAGCSLCA
jgi:CheY-like chemotaxis protein